MSKIDEVISEIDGKISYADATGNVKAKEELLEIRKTLLELRNSKERKNAEI